MEHRRFSYKSLDALREDIAKANVELPVSENLGVPAQSIKIGDVTLSNRLAIHPMEGCDGTVLGEPGDLTFRRYKRLAAGGAGLIWFEACAVVEEGRANGRQLYLNGQTLPSFKSLLDSISGRPYTVLQLTHSGRYSKPSPDAYAIVATDENPYLDPLSNPRRRLISDDELEALEDRYVEAARLAKDAGFDAVDVKACHRYLISELLGAHNRNGKYGGSFENRTRFLLNIIEKIRSSVNIDVTLRLNACDVLPYPYGWGCDADGNPDLKEPLRLMKILSDKGVGLVNLTIGNPYYNPHIGRACDVGPYKAPEHPIESAARMLNIIRELKSAAPSVAVIGTGFSWFREFGGNIAAGCIEKGWIDIAGFGRQSLAYPDFANDILYNGGMVRRKCCVACTKCTELMRFGSMAGCVVRDTATYLPLWREATAGRTMMSNKIATHI
ncbi:MAG: hypothetical protein LBR84_10050 [Tannerella sp.]|jgi:2,4-dienoyl-CoA reductase-like NADH-dependent reductase (Old Yellow Enzyme family)|nr:hypothetical protein [Tannerella sp.]